MNGSGSKITARDITQIALMTALIEACKFALSGIPNIELTSFWLILFTVYFGWKAAAVVPVFILIEGAIYGVQMWWIMYLYAWPLLVGITWIFRKQASAPLLALISGTFGLCFGLLCSIPYFVIGTVSGGAAAGFRTAFAWWVAGIPWDLVHCAGNAVLMLVLYPPVSRVMQRIARQDP